MNPEKPTQSTSGLPSPSQSGSYRIPKRHVPAILTIKGRPPQEIALFIHRRAASHAGPERPSDILAEREAFIPVQGIEGVELIHKESIAWITVAVELEMSGQTEAEAWLRSQDKGRIEISFDDGRALQGDVFLTLPEGKRRLQDFLNEAGQFFQVQDRGAVHLVNRSRVVSVRPTQ